MGTDLHHKPRCLPAGFVGQIERIEDELLLPTGTCSLTQPNCDVVADKLESGSPHKSLNLSTLSLVETIEYNFLHRNSENGFAMGSGVSTSRKAILTQNNDTEDDVVVDNERPPSVEVCADPGLEEAEGIAHAQILTKINSTFDAGIASIDNNMENIDSTGFANILEEYKFSGGSSKTQQTKNQKTRLGQLPKSDQPKLSGLNLTLTGLKAKPVNRMSGITPRGLLSRDRSQRARNPNVMKSMEERLSTARNNSKRPGWNQNFINKDKSSTAKPTRFRKPPRKLNILAAIKPSNLDKEKEKFFSSNFTINPQFEYKYPPNENVLQRYNNASSLYVEEAVAIMRRVLTRYGNYEKFEAATGGRLLTRTEIWNTVKRYLEREGFFGEIVVDISNDLLSRAAMTINGGRPTLSIRESSAREYWVEGLLRHEVGTHHLRFHNNRQQVWHNCNTRRQMELQPANPTEEGLASLHSVLLRKDPSLWRAAMLYYAVYKASKLSFVQLFADLGKFLDSPEVRWDYCLRTKRGQTDTSKPGCFCKDQVYLNGILALLQRRKTLDFHMLCTLGKVSHEDIGKLRENCNKEGTKIPTFMKDIDEYRRRLDYIVNMNGLDTFLEGTSGNDRNDGGS
ncbi:microtubule-associated tyrosine carboxypeptidase 1-like [Styela clava]